MIEIFELNENNVTEVSKCSGEFVIDSKLVLSLVDNHIHYEIIDLPKRTKRYRERDVNYTTYINNPERTIFFAYIDSQIAGQIILTKYWNNYAYIQDIAVDVRFRRQGVGKALMERAKQWARKQNLPGIMLETQDINVAACKFYKSCGFKLRGFDTHLYKGIEHVSDEIALYWYYLFEGNT
ncbi:MAG: GNAT family N-acetyltransferase [Chloroflexota bacterium]|nr:GNAT family N-acetyltransferase [Chloroflexota bacterium]